MVGGVLANCLKGYSIQRLAASNQPSLERTALTTELAQLQRRTSTTELSELERTASRTELSELQRTALHTELAELDHTSFEQAAFKKAASSFDLSTAQLTEASFPLGGGSFKTSPRRGGVLRRELATLLDLHQLGHLDWRKLHPLEKACT